MRGKLVLCGLKQFVPVHRESRTEERNVADCLKMVVVDRKVQHAASDTHVLAEREFEILERRLDADLDVLVGGIVPRRYLERDIETRGAGGGFWIDVKFTRVV